MCVHVCVRAHVHVYKVKREVCNYIPLESQHVSRKCQKQRAVTAHAPVCNNTMPNTLSEHMEVVSVNDISLAV